MMGQKSTFCDLHGTTRRVREPGIKSFPFERLFPEINPAGTSAVLAFNPLLFFAFSKFL
jgi:hypothetical protein